MDKIEQDRHNAGPSEYRPAATSVSVDGGTTHVQPLEDRDRLRVGAMIRISKRALTAALATLIVAGQAHALTLANRDQVDRRLLVTEAGDQAVTQEIFIASDEILEGVCPDGCTIALENGVKESFEGYEDVAIEDGRFVINE
jgi:hypothetical protein